MDCSYYTVVNALWIGCVVVFIVGWICYSKGINKGVKNAEARARFEQFHERVRQRIPELANELQQKGVLKGLPDISTLNHLRSCKLCMDDLVARVSSNTYEQKRLKRILLSVDDS